jgi:hypothetical protein
VESCTANWQVGGKCDIRAQLKDGVPTGEPVQPESEGNVSASEWQDVILLSVVPHVYQYDSSTTNFYSDFKFNPPLYNKVSSDLKDISNNLNVYHQNVRGLRSKLSQLSNILFSELPHIICITEHQIKDIEMYTMTIEYYKLSTKFCRHQYKNSGVCIYMCMNP